MGSYEDISNEDVIAAMGEMNDQTPEQMPENAPVESKEAPPAETPQMFKFKSGGKEIEEPLDMVLRRAGMGYDYAQKMEALKAQQSEVDQIRSRNEELSRWEQFDKYAKENPKWAEHVQNMYENRTQYSDPNLDPKDPLVERIAGLETALETKLSGLDQRFGQIDSFLKTQQESKEDQALSTEMESIRKAHPDVDFSARNELGKSLETQVLEHMRDNQIPNYRAGFRDFYHDKLVESAKVKAQESAANNLAKQRKQGVIGESPTPHMPQGVSPANIKNMSYEQLAEMAKAELGV